MSINNSSLEKEKNSSDMLVWLMIASPFVAFSASSLLRNMGYEESIYTIKFIKILFVTIIPISLFKMDRKNLRGLGFEKLPHWAWFLLLPVYLWKRENILKRKHITSIVQILAFALTISVSGMQAINSYDNYVGEEYNQNDEQSSDDLSAEEESD